jgi:hypothetical protein
VLTLSYCPLYIIIQISQGWHWAVPYNLYCSIIPTNAEVIALFGLFYYFKKKNLRRCILKQNIERYQALSFLVVFFFFFFF